MTTPDPQAAMAYVGVKPCGCAVAIVVDEPQYKALTSQNVGEFVIDGLTIERMTCAEGVERIKQRKACCRKGIAPQVAEPTQMALGVTA